jgi:hypothetical protein
MPKRKSARQYHKEVIRRNITRRELFSEAFPDLFSKGFNPPLPHPGEYSPISGAQLPKFEKLKLKLD